MVEFKFYDVEEPEKLAKLMREKWPEFTGDVMSYISNPIRNPEFYHIKNTTTRIGLPPFNAVEIVGTNEKNIKESVRIIEKMTGITLKERVEEPSTIRGPII